MSLHTLSRRSFLSIAAAAPAALSAQGKRVPIGLELYSVRNELSKDLMGTVRTVGKMGYECVEFYSPYYQWTTEQAKEVRKLLDDLNVKCHSTHNGANALSAAGLPKAIELNQIIGSRMIIMASAGRVQNLDGWKGVAETLTKAAEQLKPLGMSPGFHNHQSEFRPVEGTMPMEVLASNTPKDVVLQLDVGTCVEVGVDPVAWIKKNPGRIRSMHLKEWAPGEGKGYRVLLGEGTAPWKAIFQAAESVGGIEFYLIEQEGSDYTPFETAERCLATYRKMRAS
jgi:sugar phosphate isomerase/epimerase